MELNEQYKKVIAENTFINFDFVLNTDYFDHVIEKAKEMGFSTKDLFEPVDGFHPNQLANKLMGDYLWDFLLETKPKWVGKKNPHNSKI